MTQHSLDSSAARDEPPSACETDLNSPSGLHLSRRQILMLGGVAVAGGAYYLAQEGIGISAEAEEMYNRLWLFESGLVQPQFPFQEPSPAILSLVQEIYGQERQLLDDLGLKDAGFFKSDELTSTQAPHLNPDIQLNIWNKISTVLPEICPGLFSPKAYYELMFRRLPIALAQYGIYAQADIACVYDVGVFADAPLYVEPVHNFYFISKVEARKGEQTNGLSVDVIFVSKPVVLEGQGMLQHPTADWAVLGKLASGNVVVNEYVHEESEKQMALYNARRSTRGLKPRTDDEVLAAATTNKDPQGLIARSARDRFFLRLIASPAKRDDDTAQTVAHEVQHFVDLRDAELMSLYSCAGVRSMKEIARRTLNLAVHTEINAHIAGLMEARDKTSPFLKLLFAYISPGDWSASYSKGLPWIVERILDEVEKDYVKFGIVLKDGIGVGPRLQILLQIDRLCDAPEQFNALLARIKESHRGTYHEDFITEPFGPQARRAFLKWPPEKIINVLSGGTAVLAALALKSRLSSFFSRRFKLKLESELRETTEPYGDYEKAISDIQLGKPAKKVDNERRLDAITRLASLPAARALLSKIFKF